MKTKTLLARYGKPKFRSTHSVMPNPKYILNIGIANNSYLECKTVYPASIYHGLDFQSIDFELNRDDEFLLRDLENESALDGIPPMYDLIIANHVLEHLANGRYVFVKLLGLLKPNGVLYAEFPSIRTAYKRKFGQLYHFHDDPTHKTFYLLEELANDTMRAGCKIISCGPVNQPPLKYLFSFFRAFYNLIVLFSWSGFIRFLPNENQKIDHIMVVKKTI